MTNWLDLLENGSDDDIVTAGEALAGVPIVVLATTYDRIHPWQELLFDVPFEAKRHPRRPVAMRGAKGCWVAAHRLSPKTLSANGAAIALFERAIRMSKLTCFNFVEYDDATGALRQAISSSMRHYGGVTSKFFAHTTYVTPANLADHPLIEGKRAVGLDTEAILTLRDMHKLITRLDKLHKQEQTK